MNKIILFALSCLLSSVGQGQPNQSVEKLNKTGIKQMKSKEYDKAILTFTEATKISQDGESYFNRAMAYYELARMSEFCDDIEMASMFKHSDAKKMLVSHCFEYDTTYVDDKNETSDSLNYAYLKIKKKSKYKDLLYFTVTNRESKPLFSYMVTGLDTVYTYLPVNMPEYPNGEPGLIEHLKTNIHYPPKARTNGITGTVYLTFIVDQNGNIRDINILKGIGGGCDEEAIRVVKLMPSWQPGIYNNKPVPVKYNLPIRFSLK